MAWTITVPGVNDLGTIESTMREWEPTGGTGSGFQSGDLGWARREGPATAVAGLRVWIDADRRIGAVGILESATSLLLAIDPGSLLNVDLAESIACDVVAHQIREVSCASPPAAIRRSLGLRGFAIDPAPWPHLWRALTDNDLVDVPNVMSTATEDLIRQRIAVQRSAFVRSTFTRERWQQMAAGTSFRPELDLLAVDEAGQGVSALTAWLPGDDTCGMIEPMGTRADRWREGHGRRLLLASFAALRRMGASGVRVYTPPHNKAAIATYQAVGFRVIALDTTLVLQSPAEGHLTGEGHIE